MKAICLITIAAMIALLLCSCKHHKARAHLLTFNEMAQYEPMPGIYILDKINDLYEKGDTVYLEYNYYVLDSVIVPK